MSVVDSNSPELLSIQLAFVLAPYGIELGRLLDPDLHEPEEISELRRSNVGIIAALGREDRLAGEFEVSAEVLPCAARNERELVLLPASNVEVAPCVRRCFAESSPPRAGASRSVVASPIAASFALACHFRGFLRSTIRSL